MLGEIKRRLRSLFHRSRLMRELDEEMALHLELRRERLETSTDDPALAARRRFGNVGRLREESVDAWGWRWLDQLAQDVRFGYRSLVRTPVFTATAIVTLALGIGATTAIFTLVNGVLLRSLPFADPHQLVQVYATDPFGDTQPIGFPDLEAFRRESAVFQSFASYAPTSRILHDSGGNERLTAVVAARSFFDVLGVAPVAGRTFRADDSQRVAVLSGAFWRRRLGGDPGIIGGTITLDGEAVTVLGVMPDTFQFPYGAASRLRGALTESRTDVWIPEPDVLRGRSQVIGRLKPGIGARAATSELAVVATRLESMLPESNRGVGVRVVALADSVVGSVRGSLWVLVGAVALVLVIACANVAELLLVRATTRRREAAIRVALGAGRGRLVRQFLTETVLLSLAGGFVGLAVADWGTRLLLVRASARIPRAFEIGMDWRALGFLLTLCLMAALFVGSTPAVTASGADVQRALLESNTHASSGTGRGWMRDGLVIGEIALAFMMAVGAGALAREFIRLQHTETGMRTDHVLTFHLTPRVSARDYYAVEERVARLPGVESAGFTQVLPLQNWGWDAGFHVRGRPSEPGHALPVELRYVTPGYVRTLGIPLVKGRGFADADDATAPRVILVNQTLARRYFPSEDPVGRETDRGTIVGVVGDVRHAGLDVAPTPEIYFPVAQNVAVASDLGMSLIVRTDGPPQTIISAVRSTVSEVNDRLAIFNIRTMDQVVSDSLAERNLYRWVLGLFAALGLLLASVGLYGVISYATASRTREFAIRLALGSDERGLAWLVLRQGIRLGAVGLALGGCGVAVLRPWLRGLSIGAGIDVATVGGVAALLAAIALVACVIPTMRVAAVDPVVALRQE